jgi:hypothetical protein
LDVTRIKRRRRFTFRASIAQEPMPVEEWQAAERLLAKLVARAYAADHPELFHPAVTPSLSTQSSGPPAAAAAVVGAPPANAGGPDRESREQHDSGREDGGGSEDIAAPA